MNLRSLFWTTLLASAGALVYGALVESNRLVVERRRLRLRAWPKSFSGFTIALLADLHLRDEWSVRLANEACRAAVECEPDLILIAGDFLGHWANESAPYDEMFMAAIGPLSVYRGRVFAVPGNHDYVVDDISVVVQGCRELGIRLLRNEAACCDGVQIVGVDSRNAHRALPHVAMALANPELPTLALWHEPDMVDVLPAGAALMLSGHSHGGQFISPWGWAPMSTKHGEKYVRGFYPDAPTPLYVTRGIGTTGPPSRLFCAPELALLSLEAE